MDDNQLLKQYARAGSEEAFRRLVHHHFDLVYSVALRHLRDRHAAEDVAQAVFIALSRKAGDLSPETVLAGWLIRATHHAAIDLLRYETRRRARENRAGEIKYTRTEPHLQYSINDEAADREAMLLSLDSAIARLTPGDRDLIVMKYLQGQSHKELATSLGITDTSAKKRLSRALARLRKLMTPSTAATFMAGGANVMSQGFILPTEVAMRAAAIGVVNDPRLASPAVRYVAGRIAGRSFSRIAASVAIVVTCLLLLVFALSVRDKPPPKIAASPVISQVIQPTDRSNLQGYPIADGWPLILPGVVTGTPIDADLLGDGRREIVVPCKAGVAYAGAAPLLHPQPDSSPLLFAFHSDGTVVKGWPVVVKAPDGSHGDQFDPSRSAQWLCHPAVVRLPGNKSDSIVMTSPDDGTFLIHGNGAIQRLSISGAPWTTPVIADLSGAGDQLVLMGSFVTTLRGPAAAGSFNSIAGAAPPCVGDALNDGKLRLYHPLSAGGGRGSVGGWSADGKSLSGWPQPVARSMMSAPVMGDVDGDEKMEVCAIDSRGNLLLWTCDGQPAPGTYAVGPVQAVLKEGLSWDSSPTLADIDGSGRASIIVFDANKRTLYAWHGDGTGVTSSDGEICKLPGVSCRGGVTVASLDPGYIDLFVGTCWIRLGHDSIVQSRDLIPDSPRTATQSTIVNINGRTHVLIGLMDGRIFVCDTGKPYDAARIQWSTVGGNPRHTGAWRPGLPRAAASLSPAHQ